MISFVTTLSGGAYSQGPTGGETVDVIEKLKTGSIQDKLALMEEIALKHNDLVTYLITVVDDDGVWKENRDVAVRAVELLGAFRAAEAVPTLVRKIDEIRYTEGAPDGSLKPPEQDFPAIGALIRIGRPSTGALLNLIATGYEQMSLQRIRYTLSKIEGSELAEIVVGRAIEEEIDPKRKQTLQDFLNRL